MSGLWTPRWKARTAGALAVLFWGASFAWVKVGLREFEPVSLLAIRFGIGTAVVWLLALWTARGSLGIRLADVGPLAGLGLIGVTLQQALQTAGILLGSASAASWLSSLAPAFIVLLAWPLLGERLNSLRVIGILVAFLGAALVSRTPGSLSEPGDPLAAWFVIASAVVWAVYSILGKGLSARRPPIVTTAWGMTFGWLALAAAFVAQRGWTDLGAVSSSGWITVILLGVASTGLAYGLYFYALNTAEAALAAALQYLEPLITMVFAAWLLQEPWTVAMLVGGALILVGVWIVDRAGTPTPTLPVIGRRSPERSEGEGGQSGG
jgi:drug/metabolite transporter (DMT)-like permease